MPPVENTSASGASLSDLPEEVILDHLLPVLPLKDLTSLSGVNRLFHALCNDEPLWHHKTLSTFRVSKNTLAPPLRTSGWSKRLYQGLTAPRVFVWGEANHGRLGLPQPSAGQPRIMIHLRWVHTPREITLQFLKDSAKEGQTWTEYLKDSLITYTRGAAPTATGPKGGTGRIVEMQAAGWSFAARDMDGGVWVWGQLDGSNISFRALGWEDKNVQVPEPTRIPLPCQAEAISCGRRHLLVLDSDNLVWELTAYGRAYHHTSPALTSPTNPGTHHIVQLSSGWEHSAVLTSAGKIHVWYPFTEEYRAALTPADQLNGPLGNERTKATRGLRWGTVGDVLDDLPPIPTRPSWDPSDRRGKEPESIGARRTREAIELEWEEVEQARTAKGRENDEKVVRISSGSDFVLALKQNGEVWYIDVNQDSGHQWEYLPYFSGPQVSHITAQFLAITSYSPSAGGLYHTRLSEHRRSGFGETLRPDPLPSLQNMGVIQVAIGDHHAAALTAAGEMYTWGSGSQGQLGLGGGVMREVGFDGNLSTPRKVSFPVEGAKYRDDDQLSDPQSSDAGERGNQRQHFVFSITAAGMHTGALVLGDPTDKTPLPRPKGALEVDKDDNDPPVQQRVNREPLEYAPPGAFPPTAHPEDEPAEDEDRWSLAGSGLGPGAPNVGAGAGSGSGNGSTSGGAGRGTVFPGGPMFRVGFPGRGSQLRGAGAIQRNWQPRGGGPSVSVGHDGGGQSHVQGSEGSEQVSQQGGVGGAAGGTAFRGGPTFRVGFAGRGSHIGEVAQRNWQARHPSEGASTTGTQGHAERQSAQAGEGSQEASRHADDLGDAQGTGRVISGGSYTGANPWQERGPN